jgi:hypothetical protein
MEGRLQGTTTWLTHLLPAPGDVIEYRLVADLARVGSVNVKGVITSVANSGLQSLSLSIVQSPTDGIQVDFNLPPPAAQSLRNGWGNGTGASPGALSPRPGSAFNDLRAIRPIQLPGVYSAVDPEVILQGGTFRIASGFSGPSSFGKLTPTWGAASGAMRINGAGQIFITADDITGPDPLVQFEPLQMGIPEPSTIALFGTALAGLTMFARRHWAA